MMWTGYGETWKEIEMFKNEDDISGPEQMVRAMLDYCPIPPSDGLLWKDIDTDHLDWMVRKDFGDEIKLPAVIELLARGNYDVEKTIFINEDYFLIVPGTYKPSIDYDSDGYPEGYTWYPDEDIDSFNKYLKELRELIIPIVEMRREELREEQERLALIPKQSIDEILESLALENVDGDVSVNADELEAD